MPTFRIDDVSLNTSATRLCGLLSVILEAVPEADILCAVSPMVHRVGVAEAGRVFPKLMAPMSDHRIFFQPQQVGLPWWLEALVEHRIVRLAGHGLFHLDHRLLSREAQEMSILASCSVAASTTFVPPFNKWNKDTVTICEEHGFTLVKWEQGWRHVLHNNYDKNHGLWYLHEHDTDPEWLRSWFGLEVSECTTTAAPVMTDPGSSPSGPGARRPDRRTIQG